TRGASGSARRDSSSARPPMDAPASTCQSRTATTSRSAAWRLRSCRTSPTRTASSRSRRTCDRSTGTAGSQPGARRASLHARAYPKQYWHRTAFVAEPTGHLVATFTLHPNGTDFHSHNAGNLAASDDEWTSPILAEVGPDGQVWVIDWYNFIVQHNPTPEGY